MKKAKYTLLLSVLTVLLALTGCGGQEAEGGTEAVIYAPEGSSDTTLENGRYRMELEENYSVMTLTDKDTGEVWKSVPTDDAFEFESLNKMWQMRTSSLFQLGYTNISAGLGAIMNSPLLQMDYTAAGRIDGNTLYVSYDLSQPGIRMTLAFTLEEDGFRVRVPFDGIEEYGGKFSIVSLAVLPFMSGATDQADGYYLYPDGSGAIMEFQDIAHIGESSYSYMLYGDIQNYRKFLLPFQAVTASASLPVYGVNINDRGYIAIMTEGDANARISLSCSTQVVPVNGLYGEFLYRQGFPDARVKTSTVLSYAGGILPGDREIYYRFLETGHTDYSAMAASYRDYLKSCGVEYGTEEEGYPLYLDILMGIEEEGLLFDEWKQVTDFDQAAEMITDLGEQGVDRMVVNLKGYTKHGYYSEPQPFRVNSSIGGKSGLKSFLKTAEEEGIPVTLDFHLLYAWDRIGGYSSQRDLIYLGNYAAMTDEDEKLFLLGPDTALRNFKKFDGKAGKYGIAGYSLGGLADTLAYSYNSRGKVTSGETMTRWKELMGELKEKYGILSVEGGNAYALGYADYLKGIPDDDQGFRFTTRNVPFYQLVTHGLAGYLMDAGNLSGDLEGEKLKWVEYGYLPYFELTYEGSEDLMYTEYNDLFTSKYDSWRDDVVSVYRELNDRVGFLAGEVMEEHVSLGGELYRVTYGDGTRVYVNYGSEEQTADGVTVPARNYTVVTDSVER
ncbi:MAG: DUF5696 domain-containing protein [Roseburia sp.]|nr:DUF5696 domain-containing protein [Roseburia sp.]MCM1097508.1 DUF5696 domain-containing protein [Ruminococcus flavefaciens]